MQNLSGFPGALSLFAEMPEVHGGSELQGAPEVHGGSELQGAPEVYGASELQGASEASEGYHVSDVKDQWPDIIMMRYVVGFNENDSANVSFYRERLLKRKEAYRWAGRVHEAINLEGTVEYLDVPVEHRSRKTQYSRRNLNIYETMEREGTAWNGMPEICSIMHENFIITKITGKRWIYSSVFLLFRAAFWKVFDEMGGCFWYITRFNRQS